MAIKPSPEGRCRTAIKSANVTVSLAVYSVNRYRAFLKHFGGLETGFPARPKPNGLRPPAPTSFRPPISHSLRRIPLGNLWGLPGSRDGEALELGAARWRARHLYRCESRRNPAAHRGLQRASGSRQAPPRNRTFAYQMRIVCRIFFSWGVLSHKQTITGKRGRSRILPGSPSSGRSLPRAFRPGQGPSVRWAQGQSSGARAPALAPACPAPQRQLGFQRRPLPALCPSAAQPRPAQPGSISGRSQPWLKIGGHLTIH